MSIDIELVHEKNIAILTLTDKASASDFTKTQSALNTYINIHDRAPSLVIRTETIPHYESFEAIRQHLKLVHDHHQFIKRVAIVSDSIVLELVRLFATLFVQADLHHFKAKDFDIAKKWAAEDLHPPTHMTLIEGLPADTVGVVYRGTINAKDYTTVLEPAVKHKLKTHDKIKLLAVLSDDFESLTGGGIWHDSSFGFRHLGDFKAIAIVTDHKWISNSAKFFGTLIPADIAIFTSSELENAKDWIRAA